MSISSAFFILSFKSILQPFRLCFQWAGRTDAADVSFRTFIIRHLMLRSLFIYAEIFLYKSSLQPFRFHFVNSSRDAGCPSVSISSAFFILSFKSILQPFRLCFRWAGRTGLFSGPAREIFFLFFGQLIDLKIHSRKLVSSDLIVDAVRNVINLFCELFSMFRKPLKAECLYGK